MARWCSNYAHGHFIRLNFPGDVIASNAWEYHEINVVSIGTRRGARACLKLVMVWVLDEYWKIRKSQNLRNFVIYPKPNLDASTGFETCSNRFFAHKNPNLSHNFAKNKNLIFRHFCFFVEPKMALFVHCWRFDSACHIICNQRKYCQIFKSIWIPFGGEIASKLC